ncbi:MAG: diacylglycerol/lipid kinase family protein [Actinomycetota bacterium]
MQRLMLLANPASSQFTGGGHRSVTRILKRRYAVELAWPQSADHARHLSAQAVADGYDVVAAMGGDGVVHHVAHALAGTETTLGVIPTGTTNVYSRLHHLPAKPNAAARLLAGAHNRRRVDVLEIRGAQADGPVRRMALFAAGFGFDAEVVRAAEGEPYRKYWFGGLHYARAAVGTVVRRYRTKQPTIRVSTPNREAEAVAVLIQFQPVYTYFGRLPLSLGSNPPEPLSVLVVESLPARRVPWIIGRALSRGDLGALPGMQLWDKVDDLTIEAEPPSLGQADGEITGEWSTASMTLRPEALGLIVPEGPPNGRN